MVKFGPLGIILDLWKTSTVPVSLTEDGDAVPTPDRLAPPPSGTIFRFVHIPPEDPNVSREQAERAAAEAFAAAGVAQYRVDSSRHPMMHSTPTVDYIVVLRGEVTLLLDQDEVTLKPFDAVVQRGTNDGWVNYGQQTALLMGVLIAAE
jgi:hypothetical protein